MFLVIFQKDFNVLRRVQCVKREFTKVSKYQAKPFLFTISAMKWWNAVLIKLNIKFWGI